MRVERVYIRNFRAFDELEIYFSEKKGDPPFSLVALTGDNGCGKTTLLDAIRLAYRSPSSSPDIERAEERASAQPALIEVDIAFSVDELTRFYECLERDTQLQGIRHQYFGDSDLPSIEASTLRCVSTSGDPTDAHNRQQAGCTGLFTDVDFRHRLFPACTQASRRWRMISLPANRPVDSREVSRIEPIERVPETTVLPLHGYGDLKRHLVNLDYLRLKQLEAGGEDLFAPFRELVAQHFKGKTFEGIEDYRLLLRTEDGLLIDHDQLSDGEKAMLNLFSSFIRADLRDSVYLIDEPEQHLHPRWQRALPDLFQTQSKTLGSQFLLATHSAEIAEGVQKAGGGVFDLSASAPAEVAKS